MIQINLPFGAIVSTGNGFTPHLANYLHQSIATVLLFLPMSPPPVVPFYKGKTTFQKWLSLDWIGAFISVAMITCLLLPLQWGGSK